MKDDDRTKERMEFVSKLEKLAREGARFSTLVGVDLDDDTIEVVYLFDLRGELLHLRISYGFDETIPSISDTFPAATILERELVDLFGVDVEGMEPYLLMEPGSGVEGPLRKRRAKAEGEGDPADGEGVTR